MSFYYTFQVSQSLNTRDDERETQLHSVGEDIEVNMKLDPMNNHYKFFIYPADISVPVETLVASISKSDTTFYADDGEQYTINESLYKAIKDAINNNNDNERFDRFQASLSPAKAKNKRRRRERKLTTPPRPSNCFMIYRQDMWKKLALVISDNVSNTHISKFIGAMWKMESGSVRKHYENLAQTAVALHGERYPGYKYQPAKPKEKKKPIRAPKTHQVKEYSDGSREEVHTDIWQIPQADSQMEQQQPPPVAAESAEIESADFLDMIASLGNTSFTLPDTAELPISDIYQPLPYSFPEFPYMSYPDLNFGYAIPFPLNDATISQLMGEMNNYNSQIPANPVFFLDQ